MATGEQRTDELSAEDLDRLVDREIQQLKEELATATGEQGTDELSAEDLDRLVDSYRNITVKRGVSYGHRRTED